MQESANHSPSRRGLSRIALLAAALIAVSGGSIAAASWSQEATAGRQVLTAGNLQLTMGDSSWVLYDKDNSPIKTCSIEEECELPQLLAGESLEIAQPLSVEMEGNNLEAQLVLNHVPSAPEHITRTVRFDDGNGLPTSIPITGESEIAFARLPAGTRDFKGTLVYEISAIANTWVAPDLAIEESAESSDPLTVSLRQVRDQEAEQ